MSIEASINSSISGDILSSIGSEGLAFGAIAQYDDSSIIGTNPVTEWKNKAGGSTAFDLDVVVGTAANLITLDTGVALLTGVAGDFYSTPDSVAASITGDIDIHVNASADDWTPAAISILISKDVDSGNQRSWFFAINTDGTLRFSRYTSGATASGANGSSTSATGFTNGTTNWVRCTYATATGNLNFFTSSDDGETWDALGTEVTITDGNIFDGTATVDIGTNFDHTANRLTGKVARARIHNGIAGTLAVDFDPSKAVVNTTTFTSDTGEVWTANGDAFVNATGFTGIYSRGSVGLETTAGQDITTSITMFIVLKPTLTAPGADTFLFDARSDAAKSVRVFSDESNSDKWTLDAGGTPIALSQAYTNDFQLITVEYTKDASSKLTISGVGSVTGDAGAEDLDFGSFMKTLSDTLEMQGLFLAYIVYNRALNASEVTQNQTFLEGQYKL